MEMGMETGKGYIGVVVVDLWRREIKELLLGR